MVVDPELHYCNCGYSFKFGSWSKVRMLLQNSYKYTCPRCGTIMIFRLVNHVVKVDTVEVKGRNEVWKNG